MPSSKLSPITFTLLQTIRFALNMHQQFKLSPLETGFIFGKLSDLESRAISVRRAVEDEKWGAINANSAIGAGLLAVINAIHKADYTTERGSKDRVRLAQLDAHVNAAYDAWVKLLSATRDQRSDYTSPAPNGAEGTYRLIVFKQGPNHYFTLSRQVNGKPMGNIYEHTFVQYPREYQKLLQVIRKYRPQLVGNSYQVLQDLRKKFMPSVGQEKSTKGVLGSDTVAVRAAINKGKS